MLTGMVSFISSTTSFPECQHTATTGVRLVLEVVHRVAPFASANDDLSFRTELYTHLRALSGFLAATAAAAARHAAALAPSARRLPPATAVWAELRWATVAVAHAYAAVANTLVDWDLANTRLFVETTATFQGSRLLADVFLQLWTLVHPSDGAEVVHAAVPPGLEAAARQLLAALAVVCDCCCTASNPEGPRSTSAFWRLFNDTLTPWLDTYARARLEPEPEPVDVAQPGAIALAVAEFGWRALILAVPALLVVAPSGEYHAVPAGVVPWADGAAVRVDRAGGGTGSAPPLGHLPDNWALVEALIRRALPHLTTPAAIEVRTRFWRILVERRTPNPDLATSSLVIRFSRRRALRPSTSGVCSCRRSGLPTWPYCRLCGSCGAAASLRLLPTAPGAGQRSRLGGRLCQRGCTPTPAGHCRPWRRRLGRVSRRLLCFCASSSPTSATPFRASRTALPLVSKLQGRTRRSPNYCPGTYTYHGFASGRTSKALTPKVLELKPPFHHPAGTLACRRG